VCMSDKSNAHDLWRTIFGNVYSSKFARNTRPSNHATLYISIRWPWSWCAIPPVTAQCDRHCTSSLATSSAILASAACRWPGFAPSGNIIRARLHCFEPVHGSAPNMQARESRTRLVPVLASAMMLDFLGWTAESAALDESVKKARWRENFVPPI